MLRLHNHQRVLPYLIFLFLVTLLFTLGSAYPYEIDADTAFQLKSVQQWLRGESDLFNAVVLPSPYDLSQDVKSWIAWWPPGIPIFFLPFMATGLPLGEAARLTVYVLSVVGSLGWLKIADNIKADWRTKVIIALILPFTSGSITALQAGDILPFGLMSWLFVYVLYIISLFQSAITYKKLLIHCSLIGILLGSVYWLKYSAFLISLGVLAYLTIYFLVGRSIYSVKQRFILLLTVIVLTAIPFVFLNLLNQHFTGGSSASQHGNYWLPSSSTRGMGLLISLLGSLGLALFNSSFWLSYYVYNSPLTEPLFSFFNSEQKTVLVSIAGIPGTVVFVWLLLYSRKFHAKTVVSFVACISFVKVILLAYLTYKLKYNVLVHHNLRFVSPFIIFPEILIINAYFYLTSNIDKFKVKLLTYLLLVFFFLMPNFFMLLHIKNSILDRLGQHYIVTENHLYNPTLSRINVKLVVANIDKLVKSQKDIIVLALEEDAPFGPWLEMKQRTLLLAYFWGALVHSHGSEGANIKSTEPLMTSQNLRLILVISKSLEKDKNTLLRLKQRFPQNTGWMRVEEVGESDEVVSIWFTDLKS